MLIEGRVATAMILGLLGAGTIGAMAAMVHQWRRGRLILADYQVKLRLFGGALVLTLWGLLAAMLLFIPPLEHPGWFVACFCATLVLALALPLLALLDLRLLARRSERMAGELTEEFIRTARARRGHDA